ncbi:uncharacterized protein DC041_0002977 [Schistosoma bovis]|uniref:Receptor ligand binding region domain-containing protein n=1 Tax=Schistosoma bovis TaxID=6184 RepID=A0A430Q4Y9_SCHBO|nr:uncharacterized protein DC041_0002977 [Schistosoma bovis]
MDRPIFKLSYRLVFLVTFLITFGSCLDSNSPTPSCLSMSERSKWNRSFHFNNQELRLKLEVTNRSSHWIVNYIFEILARERLGYQFIEFVKQDMDHPRLAISRLDCKDSNCYKLPDVHINLELWLSLGTITSSWVPNNRVIDNGPLGPTNRWAISSREEFMSQVSALTETQSDCRDKPLPTNSQIPLSQTRFQSKCDLDMCYASKFRNEFIRYFTGSEIPSKEFEHFPNLHSSSSVMSIINWYPHELGSPPLPSGLHFLGKKSILNSTEIKTALDKIYHCSRQYSGTLSYLQNSKKSSFCQFESQQATKLSWAKLKSTVPLIYQLVDRMHFSQSEYEDLLKLANNLDPNSGQDLQSQYRDIACKWLRLSPTRWASWTKGWNKKLNLTVAGLFAFYGKWVVSNLDHVAEQAINFVNHNPDYFSNTEYALTLDIALVPFRLLEFTTIKMIRISLVFHKLAALCSDSIEPVVEVANMRRQIVVSPTVESVRFAKRHQYPYFFRTVPSMTHVSLILIRLFSSWGWRRVAVFREDDHFFDPLIFQSNGIDLIADFVMKENQLTYVTVHQALKLMNDRTSRIFMVEYFAKGTAIILCAAYHLGMHFDAGYVWFLNPWLSSNWWQAPDVHPRECTHEEMHNITSWTFTVGHQLIMEPLAHKFMPSSFNDVNLFAFDSSSHKQQGTGRRFRRYSTQYAQDLRIRKFKHPLFNGHFTNNYDDSPSDSELQRSVFNTKSEDVEYVHSSHDYAIHTYESVIVLAAALIHLLHQNPSAISVFESMSVAEAYRELVFETDFRYTISSRFIMDDSFTNPVISLDTGFHYVYRKDEIKSASQLRFNNLNERVADFWLLKQHQINITVPIVLWSLDQEFISDDNSMPLSSLMDAADLTNLAASERFAQLMGERWINDVNWGNNDGPPDDGSEHDDDCVFGFVSRIFGVNCTGSTVIATISIVLSVTVLCLILFIVYYRRKLKKTQLRIRQPYENLCNELKDIDHQWQHRPASLDHIIAILRKNPDCVRPFLTNEPPKPNSTIDALRFQPGAGACIMSKNTLASGDPSPSNPLTCNTTSDGIHGYPISSSIRGVLSATGSLGGSGKSPLGHHSADSFSENLSTSAFLSFLSEAPLQNLGRRRHKTADGSTTACRYQGIRRGTSSSSCGHTFRSSEHSSGDRSTAEDQPHLTSEVLRFPNWQKFDSFSPKSTISFEERRLKNYSKTRHGKPSPIRKIFSKQTSVGDEHMELVLPKNPTDYRHVQDLLNQSFVTPISYPQDESKTRTSQGEIVYECEDFQNVQRDNNLAFLSCFLGVFDHCFPICNLLFKLSHYFIIKLANNISKDPRN